MEAATVTQVGLRRRLSLPLEHVRHRRCVSGLRQGVARYPMPELSQSVSTCRLASRRRRTPAGDPWSHRSLVRCTGGGIGCV